MALLRDALRASFSGAFTFFLLAAAFGFLLPIRASSEPEGFGNASEGLRVLGKAPLSEASPPSSPSSLSSEVESQDASTSLRNQALDALGEGVMGDGAVCDPAKASSCEAQNNFFVDASGIQADLSLLTDLVLEQRQAIRSLDAHIDHQLKVISDLQRRLSQHDLLSRASGNEASASNGLKGRPISGSKTPPTASVESLRMSSPPLPRIQEARDRSFKREETGYPGKILPSSKSSWNEYFDFLFASRIKDEITSVLILSQDDTKDNACRFIVIGDEKGKVSIISPTGDLLLEYETLSFASVTALLAIPIRRNETWLVSGHNDGSVLMHAIHETWNQDSVEQTSLGSNSLVMKHLKTLFLPSSNSDSGSGSNPANESLQKVTHIELYRSANSRYILTINLLGTIHLYRSNGSLYGSTQAPHLPLAFLRSPSSQRMLFLTPKGVSSLDLKSMTVHSSECFGLNNSEIVAYVFDPVSRSRAYGITTDKKIVYVVLSGDMIRINCQVRVKLSMSIYGVSTLVSIRGQLVILSHDEVGVWNTTSQKGNLFGATPKSITPKFSFMESTARISSTFDLSNLQMHSPPIAVSNKDRLVAIAFERGYISVFKSNTVLKKASNQGPRLWSSPVLFLCLLLAILWQMFSKRQSSHAAYSEPSFPFDFPSPTDGPPAFYNPDDVGIPENSSTDSLGMRRRLMRERPKGGALHIHPDAFRTASSKAELIPSGLDSRETALLEADDAKPHDSG